MRATGLLLRNASGLAVQVEAGVGKNFGPRDRKFTKQNMARAPEKGHFAPGYFGGGAAIRK